MSKKKPFSKQKARLKNKITTKLSYDHIPNSSNNYHLFFNTGAQQDDTKVAVTYIPTQSYIQNTRFIQKI